MVVSSSGIMSVTDMRQLTSIMLINFSESQKVKRKLKFEMRDMSVHT